MTQPSENECVCRLAVALLSSDLQGHPTFRRAPREALDEIAERIIISGASARQEEDWRTDAIRGAHRVYSMLLESGWDFSAASAPKGRHYESGRK